MRLLVDVQCIQSTSSVRGIGRYALSLTRALVQTAGRHRVELLLNAGDDPARLLRARSALEDFLPPGRVHVFDADWAWTPPYDDRRRPAAEAAYAAAVRSLRPDVLLVASPFEGDGENVLSMPSEAEDPAVAAVLYDLIPALEPQVYLMGPGADVYWRRFEQVKRCGLLLSISEHSGRQATRLLGAECPPVAPIWGGAYPSGTFPSFEPQTDDSPDRVAPISLPDRFVLAIGGDHPRKNLDRLVQAWARVPAQVRARSPLVVACRLNPGTVRRLRRYARRGGIGAGELVLTGGVSERTLARLYDTAYASVFPSTEEGLGMPPLESMAAGCPTVLARGSSLDELCDEPAAYFDGLRVDEIAFALLRVLTDDALRDTLRSAAARTTERFTWENSARRAWTALEALDDGRSRLGPTWAGTTPTQLSRPEGTARLARAPRPVVIDAPLPDGALDDAGLSIAARALLAGATVLVCPSTQTASVVVRAGLLDAPVLVGTAGLGLAAEHDFYAEYARALAGRPPDDDLCPALVRAVESAPRWMLERPRPTWLVLSAVPVEPALVLAASAQGVDLVSARLAGVGLAGLVDAVLVDASDLAVVEPELATARRRGTRVVVAMTPQAGVVGAAGTVELPAWCQPQVLSGAVTSLAGWQPHLPQAAARWGRTTGWPWRGDA